MLWKVVYTVQNVNHAFRPQTVVLAALVPFIERIASSTFISDWPWLQLYNVKGA